VMPRRVVTRALLSGAAVVFCLTGCNGRRRATPDPAAARGTETQLGTMPGEEVLGVARRSAKAEGYDLDEFAPPKITFDSESRQWWLFFEGEKNPAPGNHFSVVVDDRTGRASVFRGE